MRPPWSSVMTSSRKLSVAPHSAQATDTEVRSCEEARADTTRPDTRRNSREPTERTATTKRDRRETTYSLGSGKEPEPRQKGKKINIEDHQMRDVNGKKRNSVDSTHNASRPTSLLIWLTASSSGFVVSAATSCRTAPSQRSTTV